MTSEDSRYSAMCPHCGSIHHKTGLIPYHIENESEALPPGLDGVTYCPGSMQNPRNPFYDQRLLWNGQPNTNFKAY